MGKHNNELRRAKAGIRIGVRLPPYIYFRLSELAEAHNVSLSVMFRALLKKSLDKILDEKGFERDQGLW